MDETLFGKWQTIFDKTRDPLTLPLRIKVQIINSKINATCLDSRGALYLNIVTVYVSLHQTAVCLVREVRAVQRVVALHL